MKIIKIKETDISNGPGIRVSIFVSGCRHACKGCFNKEAWDFSKGFELKKENIDIILNLVGKSYISGVSLLGGEPLEPFNQKGVYEIIKEIRKNYPNKTIWIYSGFVYEYILDVMYPLYEYSEKILNLCDVLVDGKFEIDYLDLKLKFRGSANQRIIDLKKTRKEKRIIWAIDDEEEISKYIEVSKDRIIDKRMDELIRKKI